MSVKVIPRSKCKCDFLSVNHLLPISRSLSLSGNEEWVLQLGGIRC